MECISYKKGYRYQLTETYQTNIDIIPDGDVDTPYIKLTTDGHMTIEAGYAWDGPSGPTIDTLNFMRGSLVHDALYQLMRNSDLDSKRDKNPADRLLQKMCKIDGMKTARAWWVYQGLKLAGKPATLSKNKKRVFEAPKSCR